MITRLLILATFALFTLKSEAWDSYFRCDATYKFGYQSKLHYKSSFTYTYQSEYSDYYPNYYRDLMMSGSGYINVEF